MASKQLGGKPPSGSHDTLVKPQAASSPLLDILNAGSKFSESQMVGETFGTYTLVKLLGKGGMGSVFLGEDPANPDHPLAAVKLLHPSRLTDLEARSRFIREMQIASRLNHKNIVSLVDFGETSGIPYLVMEFLKGKNLSEYLDGESLDTVQSLRIMLQLCSAMEAFHALHIIHRDLKLDNLFLLDGPEMHLKVIDLGLAKALRSVPDGKGQITMVGTIMGTPEYMAPELIAGKEYGNPLDIYAAGIILYRLLCGVFPFTIDERLDSAKRDSERLQDGQKILMMHITQKPVPPSKLVRGLPTELNDIVLTAIEKDPKKRFQNFSDMEDALNEFIARRGIDMGAFESDRFAVPVAQRSIAKPVLTHATTAIAAAAAFAFAVGGAVPAYLLTNPEPLVVENPEPAYVQPAPKPSGPFNLKVIAFPADAAIEIEVVRQDGQVWYQDLGRGTADAPMKDRAVLRITARGYETQMFEVGPENPSVIVSLDPSRL